MAGILDTIFGGGSSSSKSTPKDITPPELQALRTPFAIAMNRLMGTSTGGGLSGVPFPSGPLVAPMAPGEQAALAEMRPDNPMFQASNSYLTKAIGGNYLPGQAGQNPFLDSAIQSASRPILQGLQDLLSRELPGRFTQGGHFVNKGGSSPFDFAAARATGDVANAIGDIGTKMAFQAYDAERGRQQEAVQISQQQAQTMMQNLQAQALPRLISDLGIERGQEIFKTRLQALLQALGVVTNAPLQTAVTQSSSKSDQSSGILPSLFQ